MIIVCTVSIPQSMELLHPSLPTDQATKSIYDDSSSTDKCIALCDYRLILVMARHRCRWAGHLVRMEDTRLPKRVFFGELSEEKRSRGAQRKRYKGCLVLKETFKRSRIEADRWDEITEEKVLPL